MLTGIIIISFKLLIFLFYLFLQIFHILRLHISNGYFLEVIESLSLGLNIHFFDLVVVEGTTIIVLLSEHLLEDVKRLILGLLTLILTNVDPGGLNTWNCSFINRFHVRLHQIPEHGSVQTLSINFLGLDSVQHLLSKDHNLVDELWSELLHWDINEILELILVGEGSDHGDTVPIGEETLHHSPDSILLLDTI